jgi:hypothetical protein
MWLSSAKVQMKCLYLYRSRQDCELMWVFFVLEAKGFLNQDEHGLEWTQQDTLG